ncbi:MAG: hypothetical protein K0S11_1779 [Gammaproteobacteria bacterium]|jgi:hypothetical protein|nr:hypothetical protein [Gammaproteobacteria bacterium]
MTSYKTILTRLENPLWRILPLALRDSKFLAALRPANRKLAKAYHELQLDYNSGKINEQQAKLSLAMLLDTTRLTTEERYKLELNLLSKELASITGNEILLDPLGPYAGHTIKLVAQHNYSGASLLHNHHNYHGKAVDNREFLVEQAEEKKMQPPSPS